MPGTRYTSLEEVNGMVYGEGFGVKNSLIRWCHSLKERGTKNEEKSGQSQKSQGMIFTTICGLHNLLVTKTQ